MRFMTIMIPVAARQMGEYNERRRQSGVLLSLDGLTPPSTAARVAFASERPVVTDGPFAETKEVIGGYWMIRVASRAEAIEWVKRCPAGANDVIETRRVFEMEDIRGYLRLLRRLSILAGNPLLDTFSRCLVAHDARVRTVHTRQLPTRKIADYLALCQDLIADRTLESARGIAKAKAHSREFMVELARHELT